MSRLKTGFVVLLLLLCCCFLSGCWDNIELDEIFIVTALAIDKSDKPGEIEITVEVAKTGNATSGKSSKGGEGSDQNVIILKSKGENLLEAIERLNYDSSRTIILEHSQLLLFSEDIANEGIERFFDFFIRDRQPRVEVVTAIVEGEASKALEIDPAQELTTSSYIVGILNDLEKISKHKIRIIDLVNDYLSVSGTSVLPVLKLDKIEDQDHIKINGVCFIKNGKIESRLGPGEGVGFYLLMNETSSQTEIAKDTDGIVSFSIQSTSVKKELKLMDCKLVVKYRVYPVAQIAEVFGFENYDFGDFLEKAKEMLAKKMKEDAFKVIDLFKQTNFDGFNYSVEIYKKNPKLWESLKQNWQYIFENSEIEVEVTPSIPSTGKSSKTVIMGKKSNDR